MNVENKIKNCEHTLKEINNFNPDPYYVDYFFKEYLHSVNDFYNKIFEEVNREFGLFLIRNCNQENLEKKAIEKDDQLTLKFLSWFEKNYKNEHSSPYPSFIQKLVKLVQGPCDFPKICIKILANQRYQGDFSQEIKVGLNNEKLKSKEELQIEIRRQIPIFLEIINEKRKKNNEPKASETQIFASTFLVMKDFDGIEIPYACQVYIPVMIRILSDSRKKIKELINSY